MRTIRFSWIEEQGTHSLSVQYPKMFPFQVEEIEEIARKWGFAVEGSGQRQLGELSGHWTPPEPSEAIPALRNELSGLGYTTIFEGEDEE